MLSLKAYKHASTQELLMKSMFGKVGARYFAAISQDCKDHLKKLGIKNENVVFNPT